MIRILSAVLFLITAGCHDKTLLYHETYSLEGGVWYYSDTLNYQIPLDHKDNRYQLSLLLHHSTGFAYQNIYLKSLTLFPDDRIIEDVFSIDLADKTGEWYGDCEENYCSFRSVILDTFHVEKTGIHHLSLMQYSRTDSLSGIRSVGIRLKKV